MLAVDTTVSSGAGRRPFLLGFDRSGALGLADVYLTFPGCSLIVGEVLAGVIFLGGVAAYVVHRPAARRMIWPR
ncbi:MAG TPA: hypothetical protein VGP07_00790 [Polyangia bacterium]